MTEAAVEDYHTRDKWSHKCEFLLASIGWAVGYGNVWRFPYQCYKYGGGAFLIPYVCALLFAGVPMYCMELALGQYSSLGPNKVFEHMAPLFHGIGWGCIVVSALVAVYFNLLISWSMIYLVASFRSTLLWTGCTHDWNTQLCYSNLEDDRCVSELGEGARFFNQTCFTAANWRAVNATFTRLRDAGNLTSPAEEFFFTGLLRQSDGFHDWGEIQWHIVLAQVASWALVYVCIFHGVKTSGKVVYFTATFPYVLITILLIRGITLDGAGEGIYYYLVPTWEKLAQIEVWKAAAIQIFYTYGVAFGVVITIASYNEYNSNVLRDAFTICVTDSSTSFYTGFAVFSTTGFIAKQLSKKVPEVVTQGTGLAFVVYAEALSRMPWGPFWSVLFFFMMILIGLDSQFPMIECPATAFMDEFPQLRKSKPLVFLVFCIIGFLLGLPMCFSGGIYIFTLINDYSAGYCLMLLSLSEALVVIYVYGFRRFKADIELMIGKKSAATWGYWMSMWMAITPIYLFVIFIYSFIDYGVSSVGDYTFPPGATVAGWVLSLLSILCIPIFALYHLIKALVNKQSLKTLTRPTASWCPQHERETKHLNQLHSFQPDISFNLSQIHPVVDSSDALRSHSVKF